MKKFLSVLFTLSIFGFAFAQSADIVTDLLDSDKATVGQVSYLCAVQQHLIDESGSYEDAVSALVSNNQLDDNVSSSDFVTLSKVACLFAKNWSVQGGIMFTLTNGSPRYAFKQFVADGVISATAESSATLTGGELLSLYTSCLSRYGDFDIKSVSMEAE